MSASPARIAAFDILLRVDRTDAYATELLHVSQYEKLLPKDHGLATELVMGVLRWRSLLDDQIAVHCSQKLGKLDQEVLIALRLGAYQLQFLDRIPQHAAVNESVELVKQAKKRSAAPLVNAVLRKLAANKPTNLAEAALCAHPSWLLDRWRSDFDVEITGKICAHNQSVPEVSIRVSDADVLTELDGAGIQLTPGKILTSAYRVKSGEITSTLPFRAGRIAIQDEGSQLVALLVGEGKQILDCCAAPGGKTRILAERNPSASIIALELHEHRARLLRKLVPAQNVQVVTTDVWQYRSDVLFDRVLVDAPCSGTGTLAHNPEIKWKLKPDDLSDLHNRQLKILQAAMRLTAPRGRLLYSSCSLEHEENADVVTQAMAGNSSFKIVECRNTLQTLQSQGELQWNDLDSLVAGPYLRTMPGVHPCDGFFAAILERN